MTGRARAAGVRRRAQSWLVRRVRRSRYFPVTIPDRLGQDEELAHASLEASVLVYFPDTQESLYQIEPWYRALGAVADVHPVVVVCQDSRTARRIRSGSGLPVLTVARYGTLDGLLGRSDVRLALYVNHSPRNFECLRFTSLTHVYLGHGDSDKGVSASNQVKAYDFCFVAGQAAVDRIAAHVRRYDADQHCIRIGQPQLDGTGLLPGAAPAPLPKRDARPRVLYAPTWEGAQPSVAYSSLVSHGLQLVTRLIDDGRFDVVYRPHPLSGVTSPEHAAADRALRELVRRAEGGHRVDTQASLAGSFADADLLVTDISGVALNWLPSGKPLVVTRVAGAAVEAGTRLLHVVPRLDVSDLTTVAGSLLDLIETDPGRTDRLASVGYYFTDGTDGAATRAFVGACTRLIDDPDR